MVYTDPKIVSIEMPDDFIKLCEDNNVKPVDKIMNMIENTVKFNSGEIRHYEFNKETQKLELIEE